MKRGALTLVGLGARPDADPTLDALDSLAHCDLALCVGLDAARAARVERLAREVRVFARPGDPRAARALRAALAAGRSVAWVTPRHPARAAPPPSARGAAPMRVAKSLNFLEIRLAEAREVLAFGPAYYGPDGSVAGPPREDDALISTADWPETPAARARRARELVAAGRRLLKDGKAAEAARLLNDAPILNPRDPVPWEWLGRARLALGQGREAWRMLWQARLMGAPDKRLTPWLDRALTALGRPGETSSARAAARPPGAGRVHAELAARRAAARDAEGARAAWNAAVAAEPVAAMYDARADWLRNAGLPLEGLADRWEALRLEPTATRRESYANALRRARFPALARRELERGADRKDAGAETFRLRGQSRLLHGDWRGALADAERARALGAPASALLLLRAEAAAASGRARKVLARDLAAASPAEADWLGAYAALAEGRPDPEAFERAARRLTPGSGPARLARPLAALARAWDWCPAPGKAPGLVLVGLGVAPPASLTVEGVAALRACDAVFKNSASDLVGPFLRLMCRDIRPSPFRHEYDVALLVEDMLAEVRRGKTVGFATFGHPLLFGPLARAALARAERLKVPVRVVAAPSTLGEMLSAGASLGAVPRWQVLVGLCPRSAEAAARLDRSLPTLLYPEEGPAEPGGTPLLEAVADRYGRGHRAIVLGPDAEEWDLPATLTLDEVARLSPEATKQRLVFVPGLTGSAKPPRPRRRRARPGPCGPAGS